MFREFTTVSGQLIGINLNQIVYVYPGKQAPEGQVGFHEPNTIVVLTTKTHDGLMSKYVNVKGSYSETMDQLALYV
tara:strand:- start:1898 stop:2125 length:228 start_codon:yes stop_codon:yes gene_type:complete